MRVGPACYVLPASVLGLVCMLFVFHLHPSPPSNGEFSGWGPTLSSQIWGYIPVHRNSQNLFYWLFESTSEDPAPPLVLWLTGGPGCSLMLPVFKEMGPFRLNESGDVLNNPYSWTKKAHILFLDQPVNTGFSHGNDFATNEDQISSYIFTFLLKFFQEHPKFKNLDFFVTGESFAGHYIPALVHHILENGSSHNLTVKGFAIGNAFIDPKLQFSSYARYAEGMSYIDHNTRIDLENGPLADCINRTTGYIYLSNCLRLLSQTRGIAGNLNHYDTRLKCQKKPVCYDFDDIVAIANQESFRSSLSIPDTLNYQVCSRQVHNHMKGEVVSSSSPMLASILDAGIPGILYTGEYDLMCNWYGISDVVRALPWNSNRAFNASEKHAWNIDGTLVGEAQTYGPLTSLLVYSAGHLVPMDAPIAALDIISRLISQQPFTDGVLHFPRSEGL